MATRKVDPTTLKGKPISKYISPRLARYIWYLHWINCNKIRVSGGHIIDGSRVVQSAVILKYKLIEVEDESI